MRSAWLVTPLLLVAPLSASLPRDAVPPCATETVVSPVSVTTPISSRDTSAAALFDRALPFPEFMERSSQRLAEWYTAADAVQVPDSLVRRARAVGGRWRVLVVAVDTCGDSLRQLPTVARLAELVHGLSMRVITPADGGDAVQAMYRSLDGRKATPTYVLLDERGTVQGCVVELPAPLRRMLHERRAEGTRGTNQALADTALAWYRADRGVSIATEIVALMESAAAGRVLCERGN
jgi:hypothetical protein